MPQQEGIKGRHGDIYQLKLLLFFLKEGYASKGNFYLSAEDKSKAGDYDDVIFGWEENGEFVYRVLQAKHKDKEVVKSGKFFSTTDPDFSVFKYFTSYCAIQQSQSLGNVKEFVLCTNAGFSEDQFFVTNVDSQDRQVNKNSKILYTTLSENNPIFEKYYKIDYEKHLQMSNEYDFFDELKKVVGLEKLADELFQCVMRNEEISDKNDIFKIYQIPLFNEVLENKSSITAKFKSDFINDSENLSLTAKKFKEKLQSLSRDHLKYAKLNLSNEFKVQPPNVNVSTADLSKINPEAMPYNEFKVKQEEIFGIRFLPETSEEEITAIADELANCINTNNPLNLNGALKNYRLPLTTEVINIKESKFYGDFIKGENISKGAKTLLEKLQKKVNIFEKTIKVDKNYGRSVASHEKQWTNLPDDDMLQNAIECFCKDFVLAIKQPNEKELGKKIKKELGAIFDLEDATFLVEYLFCYVIDWIISKKFRTLEKKDVDELFEKLNKKMCKGMIIGLNSEYCKKLQNYNIKFEENVSTINFVKKFLNSTNQWFPIVAKESTLLTAIKVQTAIERTKIYGYKDSLMFLSFNVELKEEVCKAFQLRDSNNLLVVVDDDDSIIDETKKQFFEKIADSMKNKKKKLIIILKDETDTGILVSIFADFWDKKKDFFVDNVNYDDFDYETKKKLKEKSVIFQGEKMVLDDWSNFDGNSDSIVKCIPFDVLIQPDSINIGKSIEKPKNYCKYYSERKLYQTFELENATAKLITENESDVFAIEGYDFESLCDAGVEKALISTNIKSLSMKVYILDSNNVHNEIEILRKNHENKIRWLKRENERMYEVKSYDENTMVKDIMNDEWVIFADIAGMGKSTLLFHAAQEIKKIYKNKWIVKIDLNKYAAKIKMTNDGEEIEAFEYMIERDVYSENTSKYEKAIFNNFLQNGSAIIMFDGFDEINPDSGELVLKMLQKLKETFPCSKFWITTRTKFREKLECHFKTSAYFFEPFDEPKQIEFLINYWKAELPQIKDLVAEISESQIKTRMCKYASKIVETFRTLTQLRWNNFLGVPLQLKMIADIFGQPDKISKSKESYNLIDYIQMNEEAEPRLPRLTIFEMYDKFMNKKIHLHLEKRNILNFDAIDSDEIAHIYLQKQLEILSIFGLKRLLSRAWTLHMFNKLVSEETIEQLIQWQKNHKNGQNNLGIIDYFADDDQPHFVHLTYAEYFAAMYLVRNMFNHTINDTILILKAIKKIALTVTPVFVACIYSLIHSDPFKLETLIKMQDIPLFTDDRDRNFLLKVLLGEHNWYPGEMRKNVIDPPDNPFPMDMLNNLYCYLSLTYRIKKGQNDSIKTINFNDYASIDQSSFFRFRNIRVLMEALLRKYSELVTDNAVMEVLGKYSDYSEEEKHDTFITDYRIKNQKNILWNEQKGEHIEYIIVRNHCLQKIGKVLYDNREPINIFLPTLMNEITDNENEFYNVEDVTANGEHIFTKGTAHLFITPDMGFLFPSDSIILGIKIVSMLDDDNKCKNLSDFHSVLQILITIQNLINKKERESEEISLQKNEEFEKIWETMKSLLQVIRNYQRKYEFVFLNPIKGLNQWLKHGCDFDTMENYYCEMNKFFSSTGKTDVAHDIYLQDGLTVTECHESVNYVGALTIFKKTGQKYVATFFSKNFKKVK